MTLFALVDCNNFYASCERVFKPALQNKPIVVLSNNDGCVIARSNEAKALNIQMGSPFFKNREIFKKHHVEIFSSNYELYGDMSARVMATLETMCPDMEIYSIDEAFLQLDSFQHYDLFEYGLEIKNRVYRWTGLPISIGIAPTKTLAKIANHIAKKKTACGVFDLRNIKVQEDILSQFAVADIWGIGRQLSQKLIAMNIHTAKDLRDANPKDLRKRFSVVMEKIIYELRGQACLGLEELQPKKQIMSSRSFGKTITRIESLREAVAYHVTKAAEKLRKQNSRASGIYFFLHTNPFSLSKKQYANAMTFRFPEHTHDTSFMMRCAMACLKKLFKPGFEYHKLGIMLLDIVPNEIHQQDLFLQHQQIHLNKKETLMKTLDDINAKMGRGTLKFCAEGFQHEWSLQSKYKSNRYTTCLDEVHHVYCK